MVMKQRRKKPLPALYLESLLQVTLQGKELTWNCSVMQEIIAIVMSGKVSLSGTWITFKSEIVNQNDMYD